MPLPSFVQTTDTFNTWLDVTNNLISYVANTDPYVLVNTTTNGNVSVNGALTTATLVANANVVLGGSSLGASTPLLSLKLGAGNTNTASFYGTNLSISMTNTVWSGTGIDFAPNVVFNGLMTVAAPATFTKNVALGSAVLSINTTADVTLGNTVTLKSGSNIHLTVNSNSTVSQITTNSSVYTTTAGNTFFHGTNLILNSNTLANGTFTANSQSTFNGNATFTSNVTFGALMALGGPLTFSSAFVETGSNLSGGGIEPPLPASANAAIHRVNALTNTTGYSSKVIAGVQQANTSQYRQLVLFNTGNNTITFQHANGTAGANGVLCPGNTSFDIPAGGTTMVYYDASVGSGARWRVISAPIFTPTDASATVSGYVNTVAQTFAGAKTFNGTVVVANTVDLNNSSNGRLVLPVGTDKWST